MAGDDGFVDGGHADEVGAEGAEGADLGRGLEAGAEDGEVDACGEFGSPGGAASSTASWCGGAGE